MKTNMCENLKKTIYYALVLTGFFKQLNAEVQGDANKENQPHITKVHWEGNNVQNKWFNQWYGSRLLEFPPNWGNGEKPGPNDIAIFLDGTSELPIGIGYPNAPNRFDIGTFLFKTDQDSVFLISDRCLLQFNKGGICNEGLLNNCGNLKFEISKGSKIIFDNVPAINGLDAQGEPQPVSGLDAKNGTISFVLNGDSTTLHFKGSQVTGSKLDSTIINSESHSEVLFTDHACVENMRINVVDSKVSFDEKTAVSNTNVNVHSGGSLDFLGKVEATSRTTSAPKPVDVTLRSDSESRRAALNLFADNRIGRLDVDGFSKINLNECSLSISVDKDDFNSIILGKVVGSNDSKLVKVGEGGLEIGGDYASFLGTTEVDQGTLKFTKNIDLKSTTVNAVGGTIHFTDNSSAGTAKINVTNNSRLVFEGESTGAEAEIRLDSSSEMEIHQNNSLALLSTGKDTTLWLNDNDLTIGRGKNSDSQIDGRVVGSDQSRLIKSGAGDLRLTGSIEECKGTAVANEGRLIFTNDAHFSKIVAERGTVIFEAESQVNSGMIDVCDGGKLEFQVTGQNLGNEKTSITCHSNADVKFSGATDATNLTIDATDSIVTFAVNEENLIRDSTSKTFSLKNSVINANNSTISFGNKICVSSTDINIQSGGTLNLLERIDSPGEEGSNECKQLSVTLKTQPTEKKSNLQIFANNSIGRLDVDEHSNLNLNQFELKVGTKEQEDKIWGTVIGGDQSRLVKVGKGVLEIGADYDSFLGKTIVDQGTIKFTKGIDLKNGEVIASGGDIHFTDNSSAGTAKIEVSNHSKVVFEDLSTGAAAYVTLNDAAQMEIHQNNSLALLNTDPGTVVELKENCLTIGSANPSDASSLQGKLRGSSHSQLIKVGSTDLTLSGDISECEGTVLAKEGSLNFGKTTGQFSEMIADGGTILFGEGSNAKSCKINVINGGVLKLEGPDSGNQAKVELSSNGNLIVSQDNTLDSLNANVDSLICLNNASLTFGNNIQDVALRGNLRGDESSQLIKIGKSKLHLEGDKSSFIGKMHLQEGTLCFDGPTSILGGSVVLDEKTTLKGRGTINKNLTIKPYAVIDLTGNDISLDGKTYPDFHIKGDFVQAKQSICHLKVNEQGQSSLINVDGKAFIDGLMKVDTSEGYLLCTSYKILEADRGIEGAFQDASVMNGNMKINVDYLRNKVVEIRLEPDLVSAAKTTNQKNVAEAVESMTNPNSSTRLVLDQLINLSGKETPRVLSAISGEQYGNLGLASALSTSRFIRRIYTPVRFVSQDQDCEELCYNQSKIWGDFGGGKSSRSGSNGYKLDEFNTILTFQKSLNGLLTENCETPKYIPLYWLTGWTAGIAFGYSNENYQFNRGGETNLHKAQGALFALMTKSWYYFLFDIVLEMTKGKFERPIKIRDVHYKAHSDIDIFQATFYGELGLNNMCWRNIEIQPYLGIESGSFSLSSLKEHGAKPLNLKVDNHQTNMTSTYLGVHMYKSLDIDCSWGIAVDLAWRHLFGFDDSLRERFAIFGDRFKIRGGNIGQNAILGSFSVYKAINDDWLINAELAGEKWGSYSNFELTAGISFTW